MSLAPPRCARSDALCRRRSSVGLFVFGVGIMGFHVITSAEDGGEPRRPTIAAPQIVIIFWLAAGGVGNRGGELHIDGLPPPAADPGPGDAVGILLGCLGILAACFMGPCSCRCSITARKGTDCFTSCIGFSSDVQ